MSRRGRILGFGGSAVMVLTGILGVVLFGGETGEILALVLISLGFVLATSLVFLEVGLSEDRELAREARRRRERRPEPRPRLRIRRLRIGRLRGD